MYETRLQRKMVNSTIFNDKLNLNYINLCYITDTFNSGEKWMILVTINAIHEIPY